MLIKVMKFIFAVMGVVGFISAVTLTFLDRESTRAFSLSAIAMIFGGFFFLVLYLGDKTDRFIKDTGKAIDKEIQAAKEDGRMEMFRETVKKAGTAYLTYKWEQKHDPMGLKKRRK